MTRANEVRFKKLDSFTLKTSENHLIRNFLRNGRVRVNSLFSFYQINPQIYLWYLPNKIIC